MINLRPSIRADLIAANHPTPHKPGDHPFRPSISEHQAAKIAFALHRLETDNYAEPLAEVHSQEMDHLIAGLDENDDDCINSEELDAYIKLLREVASEPGESET